MTLHPFFWRTRKNKKSEKLYQILREKENKTTKERDRERDVIIARGSTRSTPGSSSKPSRTKKNRGDDVVGG